MCTSRRHGLDLIIPFHCALDFPGSFVDAVTIVIGDGSIRTVLSGETIMTDFITEVSFTSATQNDKKQDMFTYISNDEKLGMITLNRMCAVEHFCTVGP